MSVEHCTENGVVIVDETTELLAKLQKPLTASVKHDIETASGETTNALTEFLSDSDCHSGGWLQRVWTMTIRADRISVSNNKKC